MNKGFDKRKWQSKKKEEVKGILDNLAEKLTSEEEIEGFLRENIFLMPSTVPCMKWSMGNRFLVFINGTSDARGYKQWAKVGRHVKKGSKAMYILAPIVKQATKQVKNRETGEMEEKEVTLTWFKTVPVFRLEDTEGKELDYQKRERELKEIVVLPTLPLYEVSESMGIEVTVELSTGYAGYFQPGKNKIAMCTDDEQTFLHELSHAIDCKLGNYDKKDYDMGEIVAEYSACFLASYLGKRANLKGTRAYVKGYAKKKHVATELVKALDRVIAIYQYIDNYMVSKQEAA